MAQAAAKADEQARQKHARDEAAYCAKFKDCAEALKEFRNSAMQGNAAAQSNLGDMYYSGYGLAPDYAQALNWYRKAAEQGYPYGQYSLGYLYQFGLGVERNYAEALNWYRKAAAQGNADAQSHLGDMYYYGLGVAPDYVQSINWYRQAAAQGYPYAQYSLGYLYQNGRGGNRTKRRGGAELVPQRPPRRATRTRRRRSIRCQYPASEPYVRGSFISPNWILFRRRASSHSALPADRSGPRT